VVKRAFKVDENRSATRSISPALVAAKHNPDMRAKYQDMITKGKPPKVALTTIMRKLIELANVLIKEDQ
jgi:transposase